MSIWPRTDSDVAAIDVIPADPVAGTAIEITLQPLPPEAVLAGMWTELDSRSDSSFFLSWTWIGPWLALMPTGVEPQLLVARRDGETVGLALKPLLSNAEQPMNWLTLGPDRLGRRMEAQWRRTCGPMVEAAKRSLRGWTATAKGF